MNPLKKYLALAVIALSWNNVLSQVRQSDIVPNSYPYYMQSPIVPNVEVLNSNFSSRDTADFDNTQPQQRSLGNQRVVTFASKGRLLNENVVATSEGASLSKPNQTTKEASACLYDKKYFAKLDECLAKKPYTTVGLPAFKNEDLLIKKGLNEKEGCVFVLNNGLFKSFNINKYNMNSDSKCLDGNKVNLALEFGNVTLTYLWTLRCMNRADQLLEDATVGGKTNLADEETHPKGICVGSSQSFGFTSMTLSNMEAQADLSTDIFKNWRVTNATVAMPNPSLLSIARAGGDPESGEAAVYATNIKEFVFESLDGDELNWRYLHLFQNWSRNRMHTNFLDQYRRFLWISLQRCLSETSEQLQTKLTDVFPNVKLN